MNAVVKYGHHLDIDYNELRRARFQTVTALPPVDPTRIGWVVFHQPDGRLYVLTAAGWGLRATRADTADTADTATLADRATLADTATLAVRATLADTATLADRATIATEAESAQLAEEAIYAQEAGHATTATDAQHAATSTTAGHATTATTAGHASTATQAYEAATANTLQGQQPAWYLARANHTGTQPVSSLSDWDAALALVPLSHLGVPVEALDLGGQRVINGAPAQAPTDLPTYGQVVDLVSSQGFKHVRAASIANVAPSALVPGYTMDGVALSADDLVLLKDQTNAVDNGIWQVRPGGAVRAPGSDTAGEMPAGTVVVVADGTTNGDAMFMLTTGTGFVVGVDPLTFTRYGAAPQPYSAGDGINITANVISAVAGSGIIVDGTGIRLDPDALSGLGYVEMDVPAPTSGTSVTITHNLGRRPVPVAVMDNATGNAVLPGINYPDTNSVVLWFDVAPLAAQYRVGIG